MLMRVTPLFDPQGQDPAQQVFEGHTTGIAQLNNVAYPWAVSLYKQMRSNFWIPERTDLTPDTTDYLELTEAERFAYDHILAFLSFLDSLQVNNILNIKKPVSAPEIGLCLIEQLSQEGLHNHSYQSIIETVIPPEKRNWLYSLPKTNKVLLKRCQFISGIYQKYVDDGTRQNYLQALFADYILEGLLFYCGFVYFYTLASRSLMPGTADIIRLINRDELTHVVLYEKLIKESRKQYPEEDFQQLKTMFIEAIENEIKWNAYICGDNILGISQSSSVEYLYYLMALRLKNVGFDYDLSKYHNPYQRIERLADLDNKGQTKTNFFTGLPMYKINPKRKGWDKI